MNTFRRQQGNGVLWIIGLIALGVLVFLIFKSNRAVYEPEANGQPLGVALALIEGTVVCLPHRDTSGPTTMECAFGVEKDDGVFYGLDGSELPVEKQGGYDVGQRVSFEGTMMEESKVPENFMQRYNVEGILVIHDYWTYRDK